MESEETIKSVSEQNAEAIADRITKTSSLAARFAPKTTSKRIIITDENGDDQEFLIKRLAGIAGYQEIGKKISGRLKALKAKGGKLPIIINRDMIAGLETLFPDLGVDNNSPAIYLTSESEIVAATHLELVIESPVMTWSEAAVFVRVAGGVAGRIIDAFNEYNTAEAREDAKNG